jgi:hydroxycarboxylate dehydrogenase B
MVGYFKVQPEALNAWVKQLWLAAGSSETEAVRTADHLVGANLAGHDSHGVGMVPRYVSSLKAGDLQLNQTLSIVLDHGALLTVDGRRGMGQNVAFQAMELAISRAQQHGSCIMGLRNSHHLGRVGHWAEMAIAQGLVSIHFTNAVSPPWVAPHGATQGRFVTNPFTVGVPRRHAEPLLLDFATSAIAHGKARVAYNKGVPVPAGSLISADGHATNDPKVLFEEPIGALLTFAGHKGYALAMMCELLGAALTGGETTRPGNIPSTPGIWNNMLTLVFDPAKIGSLDAFEQEAGAFEQWVRSAQLAPGHDKIKMPGEPEREFRAARAQGIEIDAGTMLQMDEAAQKISSALPMLSALAVPVV